MKPSLTKARKPIPFEHIYPAGQYKCPVCDYAVTSCTDVLINDAFGYRTEVSKLKRCLNCGQLIDWEEKNNEKKD